MRRDDHPLPGRQRPPAGDDSSDACRAPAAGGGQEPGPNAGPEPDAGPEPVMGPEPGADAVPGADGGKGRSGGQGADGGRGAGGSPGADGGPDTEAGPAPHTGRVPDGRRLVIRRAVPAEATAVAEVWLRSFDTALPTVGRSHSDDTVRAWFRTVIVPRQETWVAVVDDEVVGLMVLGRAEIDQLYLDPRWRGMGIGDRLIRLAKARCPSGLFLWTFQVNAPARRFYTRHGFRAERFTDGERNEEREPDVRYVWHP